MDNSTSSNTTTYHSADDSRLDESLALGDESLDVTHSEFIALAETAASASPQQLALAFQDLYSHTRDHFNEEEARMQLVNHALFNEHRAEHRRILGDMERFYQRAERGRVAMARAWVADNLLDWFAAHVRTMDSALAAELSPRDTQPGTGD